MSFTPAIPQVGQSLGSSRPQVLDNFAILRSTIAVNHVDVNLANAGTHTHADLLAQAGNPNPATGLVSHYSKLVSGITEWFFQRENTGTVIQMSRQDPQLINNGQTFLPGGLLLKFGFAAGTAPIMFTTAFTFAPFSITLTPIDTLVRGISVLQGSVSNTGFTPFAQFSTQNYYWMAIGI